MRDADGGAGRADTCGDVYSDNVGHYTVRVVPHHPMLASGAELGLVTLA